MDDTPSHPYRKSGTKRSLRAPAALFPQWYASRTTDVSSPRGTGFMLEGEKGWSIAGTKLELKREFLGREMTAEIWAQVIRNLDVEEPFILTGCIGRHSGKPYEVLLCFDEEDQIAPDFGTRIRRYREVDERIIDDTDGDPVDPDDSSATILPRGFFAK